MKEKYELAILVVLYNKEIDASNTLASLLNLNFDFNKCRVTIWNNGPECLENKDVDLFKINGLDVSIEETIDNLSLAYIYNSFIEHVNSKRYMILDDDSTLNLNYMTDAYLSSSETLSVPMIYSQGKVRSPILNKITYETFPQRSLNESDRFTAIGSGIVLGEKLIDLILSYYNSVFDQRFYLYGVDSTFFIRLRRISLNNRIKIISGLNHSLSRLEKESKNITDFRMIERTYDAALKIRFYTSFYKKIPLLLLTIYSEMIRRIKYGNTEMDIFVLIKAFIIGKHYRA